MPNSWHGTPHSTIKNVVHICRQTAPSYQEIRNIQKFYKQDERQKMLLNDKMEVCTTVFGDFFTTEVTETCFSDTSSNFILSF
jgi:hypothetical protein